MERDPITPLDRIRLQRAKALRRALGRLRSDGHLVHALASYDEAYGQMLHVRVQGPACERAPLVPPEARWFEDISFDAVPTPTRVTATHVIEMRHPSGGILIAYFERTPESRAHPLVDEVARELEALFGTWQD